MNSNSTSDNLSMSSGRQQGRGLNSNFEGITPDPVPHQATGYGMPESNAQEICFTEYYEIMSPGFDNWGTESAGASASISLSNEIIAVCERFAQSAHGVELYNLSVNKRPYAGQNLRDPRIRHSIDLKLSSTEEMGTQPVAVRNDCVPVAVGKSTRVEPGKGGPAECLSEGSKKRMNAFKHKLVERIKLLLDPEWKKGRLSKEDYKEIVMKTTTKVVASIPEAKVPDTPEKIEDYLALSENKILNVVKQYQKLLQKAKGSKPCCS